MQASFAHLPWSKRRNHRPLGLNFVPGRRRFPSSLRNPDPTHVLLTAWNIPDTTTVSAILIINLLRLGNGSWWFQEKGQPISTRSGVLSL
jgi:hypothetical protein